MPVKDATTDHTLNQYLKKKKKKKNGSCVFRRVLSFMSNHVNGHVHECVISVTYSDVHLPHWINQCLDKNSYLFHVYALGNNQ